ncbi:MAG: selenium cofactor biosynthesis protein YqeC [Fusobacteriaceae bacterium]
MKKFEGEKIFGIVRGDVVSFTGGGGKTSLIFLLAEELSRKGRVLITTTTKIYIPSEEEYENLILAEEENLVGKKRNIDFLGRTLDMENGKLLGVDDVQLKEFIEKYDYILIEADGSAGKSMKSWNESDPVISKYTDKIIGVTNLDALGKSVEEGVHRYGDFCQEYGIEGDKKIDCNLMSRYIDSGKFFGSTDIEKYIFINGVEGYERFNSALAIVREVKLENIILGSIRERELYPYRKIIGILLGAGLSTRLGDCDKLFQDFINKPLVSYVYENLLKINFSRKIVVAREENSQKFFAIEDKIIQKEKYKKRDFEIDKFYHLQTDNSSQGQGYTIKIGTRFAKKIERRESGIKNSEIGYMYFTGDQPLLKYETILTLMKEFMMGEEITLPVVDGEEYSPVIFPNSYEERLLKIKGDKGGKSIIQPEDKITRVTFQDITEFMDVDTPQELRKLEMIATNSIFLN